MASHFSTSTITEQLVLAIKEPGEINNTSANLKRLEESIAKEQDGLNMQERSILDNSHISHAEDQSFDVKSSDAPPLKREASNDRESLEESKNES